MSKKTIVYFIIILILVGGGFFYFLKTADILSNNRFLASVAGFFSFEQSRDKNFSLTEEEFSVLKQKIIFLEESLKNKEKELENLDDLIEKFDELDQKITALETEAQTLGGKISEIQEQQEVVQEEVSNEELEEPADEPGQGTGQGLCEINSGAQASRNKILINEVAWMGTTNSANDEWVELKNISGKEINLNGWQLLDKDNQIKIIFGAQPWVLAGNGFFLLERTSDNSAPGITADLLYAGTLNNTNEVLYLFDDDCRLQDEATANPDWPAGDNSSKRTMERKANLAWQTSLNPGGTSKAENSSGYVVAPPGIGGGGGGGAPPPPVVYPKILITEVRISPINERFVELYNPNNQIVNLTGWYIHRKIGNGEPSTFISSPNFEGKTIDPFDYFLVTHPSSTAAVSADILLQLTLTPDNILLLKNPNRETADEISWQDIQESFSYGRNWDDSVNTYSDNFETQDPTPKEKNKPKTNQPPVASFVFSPQNPFIGDLVLFDAASSTDDGQIISYIWDFGDTNATTTVQAATTHSYATSTDFTVGLQVIDNEGAVSALATSTIFVAEIEAPFSELDVVINEIAWMGTKGSSNDEWIEIYNNTISAIDITGWRLVSSDGSPNINFSTSSIPATDYFLLERDDTAISDISADLIYTGVLGNNPNCEVLSLYDQNDNLIDQTICIEGNWPAGKNEKDENGEWLRVSMERIDSNALGSNSTNWASNNLITRNGLDAGSPQNNINGTPRAQNSVYQQP